MPFDDRRISWNTAGHCSTPQPPASRGLAFAVAGMVLLMIVLGGVTRLTGSGLSIMEWAPLAALFRR